MRRFIFLLTTTLLTMSFLAAQPTGDQQRSYTFQETGETIEYHLYVPTNWSPTQKLPLIVALHGMGAPVTTPFERNDGIMKKLAEERGYIVVAPAGYKLTAGYGNPYEFVSAERPAGNQAKGVAKGKGGAKGGGKGKGGPAPITDEDRARSEEDVMTVTYMVVQEYNVDTSRIYLTGNSMGGGGTWYLGQKYPARWAAIVPTAGPLREFPFSRLKDVPVLTIHGDNDTVMSLDGTKAMVEDAKAAGVDISFIEVAGGDHVGAWAEVADQIFDFFDAHQ